MSLLQRVKAAAAVLTGRDVIRATVRQYETADTFGRRFQRESADFTQRFSGYVKVATSRTASAIALNPLRLYRAKRPSNSKVWATKSVSLADRKAMDRDIYPRTKSLAAMAGDVEEVIDPLYPVLQVLSKANPEQSGFEMMELTELLQALAGTFYWIAVPGVNSWPSEIWPGFPQFMRPVGSRSDVIDHYVYGRGMEIETQIARNQVVTFRRPNPIGSPFVGVADLAACVVEADLSAAFASFALTMLDRGAQPGMILTAPGIQEDQKRAIEADLRRKVDGARNAARSLVLTPPLATADKWKVERWESAQKEAGYLAGQSEDTVLRRIAACFDIPVGLITMEETSVANGRVAAPHWQIMSILPKCRRMEEVLNEQFLPMFADLNEESLFFRFDNPVREDMEINSRVANANYAGGLLTQNEAREMLDYEPVAGGDEFKAEPDPFGGGFGGVFDDPEAEADTTPALSEEKQTALVYKGEHSPACGCDCCDTGSPKTTKGAAPKAEIAALEKAVRGWLRQVLPGLLASIAEGETITVNLRTRESRAAFEAELGDVVERIFAGGFNSAVRGLGPKAGDMPEFSVDNPRAEAYFAAQRDRLFTGVTRTATDRIMATLGEGVAEGETPQQLVARVRAIGSDMSKHQAETIARTETARAYGDARNAAWKESGVVVGKEWLLAPGGCPICADLKRKRGKVALDEPFARIGDTFSSGGKTYTVTYEDVYAEPLHPNCRCSVGAIFTEVKQ